MQCLLQSIVYESMVFFLRSNSLISKDQFGFLARRSTCTQLLITLNEWTLLTDIRSKIDSVYIDFAKAFAGADAGFRVRGGASGVSRISARGVLKVRPHTKSGGGGGGVASGPIYEKWEGGGGGGALQVRYTKSGGGGGGAIPLQIPLGTQKISTCTYLRAT